MDKKTKRASQQGIAVTVAGTCIATIYVTGGLHSWQILVLGVAGWLALLWLAYDFGLFAARRSTGISIRAIFIFLAISGPMFFLCQTAWPRLELIPDAEVAFTSQNLAETYAFTLSNETPVEQYGIAMRFNIQPDWADGGDLEVDLPESPKMKNNVGTIFMDSILMNCRDKSKHPSLVILFREIPAHQMRNIIVTRNRLDKITLAGEVLDYVDTPLSYVAEDRGDGSGQMDIQSRFAVKKECPNGLTFRRGSTKIGK